VAIILTYKHYIYIYRFNKHPSIEKDETVVDEITYQIGERSYKTALRATRNWSQVSGRRSGNSEIRACVLQLYAAG